MTTSQHYTMGQILAQGHAALSQLMLLAGKESVASSAVADTQIAIAQRFNTSVNDVVDKSENLMWIGRALAIVSGIATAVSNLTNSLGSVGMLSGVSGAIVHATGSVVLPTVQGSLEVVESGAQKDLGDSQAEQSEYGSANNIISGQSQTIISAESETMQKASAISRDLSQIVSDEKQAGTCR